jgi:hypothetical protein
MPAANHCCTCEPEDCRPGIKQGQCRTCIVLEDMRHELEFQLEQAAQQLRSTR